MFISELTIRGFKSFARNEKLKFHEGITAVVGPNGCGKTNIVDAVRWVLGEQKYSMLRGSRIDDIIFNGSSSRKPLNVCEVSLLVHNDKGKLPVDYTDVEVARRAFRSGEGEYMINRTPCRLKDIHSLFMDTGMGADAYSVIELKMIDDILSHNTDDRRGMFEEAAGINRYKQQRKSTLNKMDLTRVDLERVDDIISEVGNKVQGLRLQLKRYDRHDVLTRKLEERELQLACFRKRHIGKKLKPLKERISAFKRQHTTRVDEEKGREDQLKRVQDTYRKQQEEVNALQKRLDELSEERQACTNQILVFREQIKSTERTIERLQAEQEESSKKIESFKFSMTELNVEIGSLGPRIDNRRSAYAARKAEFEEINKKYQEADKKLEHLRSRRLEHVKAVNEARSQLEKTEGILAEKIARLKELESRAEQLESDRNDFVQAQKELEKKRKDLERKVSGDRKQLEKLDEEISGFRSEKHDLTLQFHRVANKVEGLESQLQFYREILESKEGYSSGVRHILNNMKAYPDVLGVVAELVEVDETYRPAVEAGLGPLAHCLVCETRNGALAILDELTEKGVGSVAFIPLDSQIPGDSQTVFLPRGKGVLILASDVVKTERKIEPLVRFLLKDLVIVKDASTAEALWKSKAFSGDVCDLSGRYYHRSGLITSVRGEGEMGILGRKEKITELDRAIDVLVKEGNQTQERLRKTDDELEGREGRHQDLSRQLRTHIDSLAALEREIARNEYTISQTVESLQAVTHQMVPTRKDILNSQKQIDRLIPGLKELEEQQKNYHDKIELAKGQLEKIKVEREDVSGVIQEVRFELINVENERDNLQYRIEALGESIQDLERRKIDLSSEASGLDDHVQGLGIDLKKEEETFKKLTADYRKHVSLKDLKEQAFSETYNQIEKLQREILDEQKDRERLAEELKRLELEVSDYQGQIHLLENRIQDKFNRDIPEDLRVDLSEDELSLEIDKIERSIERIGPINMAVKDEFQEENHRLGFLQKQKEDLIESEASLSETMQRIDAAARKQFAETFERIRKNFQGTFKLFFEGGEGDLTLRGNEDPLEADIQILARPPGKRTHNLKMLSSGEKALSAIALLFAIYQVKPSPFCILDEVDAPLDDHNIGKFTRVLEKFSEDTQFIIVTHNKLTMEAARFMYGVTMEQSGVSKIVSVKFD